MVNRKLTKVLILGAKGNLGQQLVKVFRADNDYEVIGWDKEEIDITDKELILKKASDLKPGIIINAVGFNVVDKCEGERGFKIAEKINGQAVGFLAEAALNAGATLVHYSSDYVFDGKNKSGYREDDKPNPISKYGESKLMGEEEMVKRSGKGLKWYLIRTSKLFGPRGTSPAAKPSFFDMMLKLSREKEELEVVNEEVSCFTYTPELAQKTKNLLDSDRGYGIYHLANEGGATWYQAAKYLFKLSGGKIKIKPVKSEQFSRPARRPKFSVLLNTKFEKMRSWQEALKEHFARQDNLL